MVRGRFLYAALAAAGILSVPAPALGQAFRVGPTFSLGGTNGPVNADVAYNTRDNQYLQVSGKAFIEGHVLSASGAILTSFRINQSANYAQFPRVAYSPDISGGAGGYLVTWHESIGSFCRVRGRIFKADISTATDDFDIASTSVSVPTGTDWTMAAAIAYSTISQEFMVAWRANATHDIYFQRIGNAGVLLGGNTQVTFTPENYYERDPSVAYNPDTNEFYIAYGVFLNYNSWVGGRRVQAGTGAFNGDEQRFGAAVSTYAPTVVYNTGLKQYLLGWTNITSTVQVYGVVLDGRPGMAAAQIGGLRVLSGFYAAYDALDIDYNPPSGQYLLVTHGQSQEDAAVSIKSDGTAYDNGFVATGAGGFGNYNPMMASSTVEKKWLIVTTHNFASTAAQFIGSDSTGGTTGRRTLNDVNGDGKADLVTFQPTTGAWTVQGVGSAGQWGRIGDIPVLGDYDGDGMTDVAVYRPSTGQWWFKKTNSSVQFGLLGDVPVPADYNGDGRTDIAIFRPSTGQWFVSGNSAASFTWGGPGDIPVPGDYNGDGRAEPAIFRRATGVWWISGQAPVSWGRPGDIPVPADYDGDGKIDPAIYRPATGNWMVKDQFIRRFGAPGFTPMPLDTTGDGKAELVMYRRSTGSCFVMDAATTAMSESVCGTPGDLPAAASLAAIYGVFGDVDGDRRADASVFRPESSGWFIRGSATDTSLITSFGLPNDKRAMADYDGDGRMDIAIWRPSTGVWYVLTSSSNFTQYTTSDQWGVEGDIPMPGDYDGDGKADLAVYRPTTGQWFIRLSSSGFATADYFNWGLPGDIPMSADFDGDGFVDPAVYRPSTGRWYMNFRIAGTTGSTDWGLSTDIPVAADFDGDGIADVAVYRPSTGDWWIKETSGPQIRQYWGQTGDVPIATDFDGDGRSEIVVFRASTGRWLILNLTTMNATSIDWGLPNDLALLIR